MSSDRSLEAAQAFSLDTLKRFDDCCCLVNVFRLVPGVGIPGLMRFVEHLRHPPQPGLRYVAAAVVPPSLRRTAAVREFVSIDVFDSPEHIVRGMAALRANGPLSDMLNETVDMANARIWLGPIPDIPLEIAATIGLPNAEEVPAAVPAAAEVAASETGSNQDFEDSMGSLDPTASTDEKCGVRPAATVTVSRPPLDAMNDSIVSDDGTARSSLVAEPPSPRPDDPAAGFSARDPFSRHFFTDVYCDLDPRCPSGVVFAAHVYSYEPPWVRSLAPALPAIGLPSSGPTFADPHVFHPAGFHGGASGRPFFTYQHRPWLPAAADRHALVSAMAAATGSPPPPASARKSPPDALAPVADGSAHGTSTASDAATEAASAALAQTASMLLETGVRPSNVRCAPVPGSLLASPGTGPVRIGTTVAAASSSTSGGGSPDSFRGPTTTTSPEGDAPPAERPRAKRPAGVFGRFCVRVVVANAGDRARRCFMDAARVGAVPVPGDVVLTQMVPPPDAPGVAKAVPPPRVPKPKVAFVESVGSWSRAKSVPGQRLATVMRLATIADVHTSERVVAAPIVAGADIINEVAEALGCSHAEVGIVRLWSSTVRRATFVELPARIGDAADHERRAAAAAATVEAGRRVVGGDVLFVDVRGL
uniref:Uncharacterized protein n=1 Tax=Neobodo designis TaxID=312471 RepID=A0A7S1LC97_NEODS